MTDDNPGIGTTGAPQGAPAGLRALPGYARGRLLKWQRVLVGLVGAALLPVMFVPILPIWRIFLVAPQYREGLRMLIFVNDLQGDLKNINILNHYIGMQQISPESFPEFGFMPWVLSVFGLVALLAAWMGRRWAAFLGWAGFVVFGTVMMTHFQAWLVEYGTNLDPKAALDFGAFTPPLFGTAHRGNFVISSYPHFGGVILILSGILAPLIALSDYWRHRRRGTSSLVVVALASLALGGGAVAARATEFISYDTKPSVSPLQERVDATPAGGVLVLPDGVHTGQLVVSGPLTIEGTPRAILDGEGRHSVLVVTAHGVVLRGFTIRNSGYELMLDDAAILLDEADDAVIEDMILEDNNHGIYVRNALRPLVRGCRITGRRGRVHEENHGNGIHVWYAKDARVEANDVSGHRDGVYLSFAETARVAGNVFHDLDRFGLHSMYSQRNVIEHNLFTRNTAGVALMFSNRMRMEDNRFAHNRGHRTYGLLLRDCSDSNFLHNRLEDNTIGIFLDGSNRNVFRENIVAENGWGVIAYSSSEANVFTGNSFLNNDYQMSLDMRRTHNRLHLDGVGNYWSDARTYDLDGDGVGDAPYHPVSLFAFVSKQHPDLTVFAGSPAVYALDMAHRSLPALQLTELVDPHPLLAPVRVAPYAGPVIVDDEASSAGTSLQLAIASMFMLVGGVSVLRERR